MNAPVDSLRPSAGYSAIARLLHWLVAGMIVLQYVLAKMAEAADEDGEKFRQLVLLANHKSVGITILGLAVLRLGWRLYQKPPPPLPMPHWQRTAAAVSHGGFYALIFALPLTGWLMSSASNISVSWFNLVQLTDFVGPNEALEARFESIHETLAKVLFVLAAVHVAAAVKHVAIDKDGILGRITSPVALAVFVIVIVAGVVALIPEARAQDGSTPEWAIDYPASHIRFTAEQAGASFDGEWQTWNAVIRFDSSSLGAASFDVSIPIASVSTLDEERDDTLQEADFFDAGRFPTAHYRASEFTANADGSFTAHGRLEIKGRETPAELGFRVTRRGDRVVLDGTATLDRLALGVGTGDWSDTQWIGQYVDVAVHVEAAAN